MDINQLSTYEASLLICAFLYTGITAIAFTGVRSKLNAIPWTTFGCYAALGVIHAISHYFDYGGMHVYRHYNDVSLLVSVLVLGVFGVQCFETVHIRRVQANQLIAYAVVLITMLVASRSAQNSLLIVAHIWAAHALYVCLRDQNLGTHRSRLSLSVGLLVIGAGSLVNHIHVGADINQSTYDVFNNIGAVIMAAGCLIMMVSLATTIRVYLIPGASGIHMKYSRLAKILIILTFILTFGSPLLVKQTRWIADKDYRKNIVARASIAGLALDAVNISQMTLSADEVKNAHWQTLHRIIERMQRQTEATRYVYLLRLDNGVMRFLVDSAPQHTTDFLQPGSEYPDVPIQLVNAYKSGQAISVGPYTDKWGSWVTAAVPITQESTGRVVAILGIDVDATTWMSAVLHEEQRSMWLMICINGLIVFLLAGVYTIEYKEQQILKATSALIHRQQQLEDLVNNLPALAYMKDTDCRYQIVNNNLCQLLQRPREQILGKRDTDLIVKQMGEEAEADDLMVLGSGISSVHQYSGQLLPNDTRNRHFMATKVPIFDDQGVVVGLIGLTQDLTEILDTRETLTRLNVELEAALKSRRENYRQLRAVMNSIPNPVYTRDSSGYYLSANRAFEELVGMNEVDIIGRSVSDIWGSEAARRLLEGVDFSGHSEVAELQTHLKRSDGEVRDVVLHKGAFFSDAGLLIGVVGLITDITNIKRMEKELSISEQRLQQIVNSLSDWVWESDINMNFVYVSDRVEFVMGYQPYELMGRSLLNLMIPEEIDRMKPIVETMAQSPSPIRQLINSLMHKDGSERIMELTGVPIYGEDGQFTGYRGVARDVTERAQSQRHNAQLLSQLTALNEDLMDFVHITSHELKGPVRSIGSLAQMIIADNIDRLSGDSHEMLGELKDRSQRLYKILDAYQQLAKVHTSFENTVTVNMEKLVREVISTLDIPGDINVQITGIWPEIPIKRAQVINALSNILINSITFMDKPDGHIKIIGSENEVDFTMKIIDNGPGIDPKYHKQIFQGFRRAQVGDQLDRTGIGLALVRRVVHAHGGRVGIDSAVDEGTTIWLTLPKTGKIEGIWGQ